MPRLEPLEDRRLLSLAGPDSSYFTLDSNVASDRLIVRFVDEVTDRAGMDTLVESLGGTIDKELSVIHGAVVILDSTPADLLTTAATWTAASDIVYAVPDYVRTVLQTSSDTELGDLWALENTGQTGGTSDADIDATDAWDLVTGSSSVVVAVIDTGCDYTHPDLAANMWTNQAELNGAAGVDDDGNGYVDDIYGIDTAHDDSDPMDTNGHGTGIAGVIGAVGDNALGVTGVSWDVQIMSLQAGEYYLYDSNIIECLDYLLTMKTTCGVNVVACNNSYGGSDYSQAFYDAIQAVNEAGILFVAAAGNDYLSNDDVNALYPACYDLDGIISVAATTSSDKLAVFSNYGATSVDLGAPGVSIVSTTLNGGYDSNSGTSLAAGYVSGAIALATSYRPDATIAEVKAAILEGTDSLASLSGITVSGGRLNVYNMLHELALTESLSGSSVGTALSDPSEIVLVGDTTAEASETDLSGSIDAAGEVDNFTFELVAGQTLTVVVDPASTLRPQVTINGPSTSYGTYSAAAAGKDAVAQTLLLSESGTYTISVTGLNSTVGSYQLAVILNAAVEMESHDGATNNSMEDAQSLDTFATQGAATVLATADGMAYTYYASTATYTFEDISATGTQVLTNLNDASYSLTPSALNGFTFDFYGTTYGDDESICFSTNGLLTFAVINSSWGNTTLGSGPAQAAIAVLWDDQDTRLGSSVTGIYWQVLGSDDNQRLVVQWNEVQYNSPTIGGDTITYQVVLYESDGHVCLNYADITSSTHGSHSDGVSATVGVKNAGTGTSNYLQLVYNDGPNEYVATGVSTEIYAETTPISADWYSFTLSAGQAASTTVTGLVSLHPQVELYNSDEILLATSVLTEDLACSIADFQASAAGTYYIKVIGAAEDYTLDVTLETIVDPPAFTVVNTSPADEVLLDAAPASITVNFSASVLLSELQASDLTVDGVSATGYTVVDGDTVTFTLPDLAEGPHSVNVSGVYDLLGTALESYSGTFAIDLTFPTVTNSSIDPNELITGTAITCVVQFSEELAPIDAADVLLIGTVSGAITPASVQYDSSTSTLTLQFNGVPEDHYTLTLYSGGGHLEDLVGHDLDGNGDGTSGGDFIVEFDLDWGSTAVDVAEFVRIEPDGSLSSVSLDNTALVNYAGDVDQWQIYAEAGQTLTIVVTSTNSAATLSIELEGVSGVVTSAGAGQAVVLLSQAITADGFYNLCISGDTLDRYQLDIGKNVLLEYVDATEDAAMAIDGSLVELGSGRYAVMGIAETTEADVTSVLWAVQPATGRILKIAADSGEVLDWFYAPDALAAADTNIGLTLAEDGQTLLYYNGDVDPTLVYRLAPTTGEVLSTYTIAISGATGGLSYEDETVVVYSESFDGGSTTFTFNNSYGSGSGLWHLSEGRSEDGDATHSPPGSIYFGTSETSTGGGTYSTSTAVGGAAISAVVSLPSVGTLTLSFNYFLSSEDYLDCDVAEVLVYDGAQYVTLLSKTHGTLANSGGKWVTTGVDLSAYAGQDIQLYFTFDTEDQYVNDYEGWYVDDVQITQSFDEPSIFYATSSGVLRQTGYTGSTATWVDSGLTVQGGIAGDGNGRQFAYFSDGLIHEFSYDQSNTLLSSISPPTTDIEGMAFNGSELLISTSTGLVYALDPDTGTVLRQFTVDGGGLYGLGAGLVESTTLPDVDAYTVELTAGSVVDVLFSDLEADADGLCTVELLAADGSTVLATAAATATNANYTLAVLDFAVPEDGTYVLRVKSYAELDYSLTVASDLTFDVEPNDGGDGTAQSLYGSETALGYLSDEAVVYSDRASLEAAHPGLSTEDFEEAQTTGSVTSCAGPLQNDTANACFAVGDILAGVSIQSLADGHPADEMAVVAADYLGNSSIAVGANSAPDSTEVLFSSADVFAVAMDVFSDQSDVLVTVYGTDDTVLATVSLTGASSGAFFGISTLEAIGRIVLSSSGWELMDNLSFGPADGASTTLSSGYDWYTIELAAGQVITVSTETLFGSSQSTPLNSLDPNLLVLGTDGSTVIGSDADSAADGKNATLSFFVTTAGTYWIRVGVESGSGEYLLQVASSPLQSDAPTAVDLVSDYDTGLYTNDNITKLDNSTEANCLVFEVSGTVAGATVTIYAGGTAIGSTTATGSTTLVTTNGTADLTDGTHSITARQTESGAAESQDSTALMIYIDTATPTASTPDLAAASDTGSYDDDNVTQGNTPQFDGTAGDAANNDYASGISTVDVYVDGVLAGSDSSGASTYSATLATLGEGTHSVATIVYDLAGNSYTTESLTVTVDRTGPQVLRVLVKGNDWTSVFLTSIGGVGYAIPDGDGQTAPLPWVNIDRLIIEFSEDVSVSEDALILVGSAQSLYTTATPNYDAGSHRATWTIPKLGADKLLIDLDGSTSSAVTDPAGNRLDGEWQNPLDGGDAWPSGDGTPGGDFQFRFNVCPGDGNQSGRSDTLDGILLRSHLTGVPGSALWSVFYDFNGSGRIDTLDGILLRSCLNNKITDLSEPVAPTRSTGDSSITSLDSSSSGLLGALTPTDLALMSLLNEL